MSQLISPFKWEDRKIVFAHNVLFVPEYYDSYHSFVFPGWNQIFQNNHPVNIEYCSGNGSWICEKALQNPNENWVAVEKQFFRVRKIWARREKLGIKNLFIICGEAHCITENYVPTESVQGVFVNFPDPWPKNRHAKHRLMQKDFIEETARILKSEKLFTLVTDDPDYSILSIEEMQKSDSFISLHAFPFFTTHFEGYGTSYFENLWRNKGKEIRYHQFKKSGISE